MKPHCPLPHDHDKGCRIREKGEIKVLIKPETTLLKILFESYMTHSKSWAYVLGHQRLRQRLDIGNFHVCTTLTSTTHPKRDSPMNNHLNFQTHQQYTLLLLGSTVGHKNQKRLDVFCLLLILMYAAENRFAGTKL